MRRAFLLVALASPALAQDELAARYGPPLVQCYRMAADVTARRACIGSASGPCMAAEPGGETTTGMVFCKRTETEIWDRLLNEEYQATMAAMTAMDKSEVEVPAFSVRAQSLKSAQRAWIAFRDAECALDYAVWGAGSMRQIAGAACLMSMTALRTIELRQKRELF